MKSKKEVDVDSLLSDWFVRRGDTYTKIITRPSLGWEDTVDKAKGYSTYFLGSTLSEEDIIRRAYSLASDMLMLMDLPNKVTIKLSGARSATDGSTILVGTDVFDDKILSKEAKTDVFCGFTIHEGCHIKYTDFRVTGVLENDVIRALTNVLEDERIEQKMCDTYPGFSKFLEQAKYFIFDKVFVESYDEIDTSNYATRMLNVILRIVRYPKYLQREDFLMFGEYLVQIKALLKELPDSTYQAVKVATEIYNIIKVLWKEEMDKTRKEAGESSRSDTGDGEEGESVASDGEDGGFSDGEKKSIKEMVESFEGEESSTKESDGKKSGSEKSEEAKTEESEKIGAGTKDAEETESKSEGGKDEERLITGGGVPGADFEDDLDDLIKKLHSITRRGVSISNSEAAMILKAHATLVRELEGTLEKSGKDIFFIPEKENRAEYFNSLKRVKRYVPLIAKVLRGHYRNYEVIHKSMRAGILDTDKLAEASQGVPTIYKQKGTIITEQITVGILVDESGSMRGSRIRAARDTVILLTEALSTVKNISLFVYGHSADSIAGGGTELYTYLEKDLRKKYRLGSVDARYENRDGTAIKEVAKRIRKFTKDKVLLFVVSDGAPSAMEYRGAMAIRDTRYSVLEVEKMGFNVVQVCIAKTYDPAKMFKHFVVLDDMAQLPRELGRVIRSSVMRNAQINVS